MYIIYMIIVLWVVFNSSLGISIANYIGILYQYYVILMFIVHFSIDEH